ncbi:MAG TPA: glutamine--tRNA ligase [Elusimicrobia bacterium]|nr:glutamine--tRNA ligase [Elusimicrobiota bacterium]HBT62313.1 glutamine--tRNA ligase [Elusimicrobiota bacterium]
METQTPEAPRAPGSDFIRDIVEAELKNGKHAKITTRFPPEPNGYLHIGHAKSICLNFGIARQYEGVCHLRFDDTNPSTEDVEYVRSIQQDVRWLGFDWGDKMFYASDYFEQIYEYAVELIKRGKAYVCDLGLEEIRRTRGSFTVPGQESPYRNRSVEENLDLFQRMRAGAFEDGSRTLRAKIDMASPNMNMRDPVLYRIKRATHHRTGDKWLIYPMYDYAHPISDAIEGITHSICTLEFEDHRPLYDWTLDAGPAACHPRQIEFARLAVTHTLMSKRKLLELVEQELVDGWDDPRLPTIGGLRRRGYTPEAIRDFCGRIGVTKFNSLTELALLEDCVRDDLNKRCPRVMAVLNPVKVVIENYPEDQVEELDAANHPSDPALGSRKVPFCRELYIEADDFREVPPPKFFRLSPGREVRLRYAYFIKCVGVVKDPKTGEVTELRCTYDPATRGGDSPDGRKVKATMHWVSARHAVAAKARLYDHLLSVADPGDIPEGEDFRKYLNPKSLQTLSGCQVEPALAQAAPGSVWQFERQGYFCADSKDSKSGALVFNRTVTLRDTWAKIEKAHASEKKPA